jgi:hypothetical protein
MQLKHIAAALSLALGLSHGGHTLAAGDPPARAIAKKLAQGSSEDMLARTVFQVLLGELALQRGDPKLAPMPGPISPSARATPRSSPGRPKLPAAPANTSAPSN